MTVSLFTVARSHADGTMLWLDNRPIWEGQAFHWSARWGDAVPLTFAEANDYAHTWNKRPEAVRTEWIARVERVQTRALKAAA